MELRSGAVTGLDGVASMATQESRAAAAAAKAAKATASAGKVDPRWCLIPQAGESHGDLEPGPHFEKVRCPRESGAALTCDRARQACGP